MSAAADQTAKLTIGDTTAEFPVLRGTAGHDSIDFSTLTRQTGYTGLDYGFVNTASTKSEITFIDGDKGILRYRGYPIEQLAGSTSYLEVAWLLIYGDLPSASELAEFDEKIRRHTLLHEDLSASSRLCRTRRTRCRCCRRRSRHSRPTTRVRPTRTTPSTSS